MTNICANQQKKNKRIIMKKKQVEQILMINTFQGHICAKTEKELSMFNTFQRAVEYENSSKTRY